MLFTTDAGLAEVMDADDDPVAMCTECAELHVECLSHHDVHSVIDEREDPRTDIAAAISAAWTVEDGELKRFRERRVNDGTEYSGEVSMIFGDNGFIMETGVPPLQNNIWLLSQMKVNQETDQTKQARVFPLPWQQGKEHLRTLRLGYRLGASNTQAHPLVLYTVRSPTVS